MAEATIPVDLLNPGQVFACLGILEAADLLLGDAVAAFVWDDGQEPTFHVAAGGTEPPVERVMRFLEYAEVVNARAGTVADLGQVEDEVGCRTGSRSTGGALSVPRSRHARHVADRASR